MSNCFAPKSNYTLKKKNPGNISYPKTKPIRLDSLLQHYYRFLMQNWVIAVSIKLNHAENSPQKTTIKIFFNWYTNKKVL
ncbi:hypothetical protein DF947_15000 [Pedobacter paludis]|uniref:Uncharacterized protein n=1 Tax=Pedobacter paludis TaxID=2203212 RepID=A0A317EVD0_9SPHI|nr:hypothetical protein DF947_15000 [Pedobacter paludis]